MSRTFFEELHWIIKSDASDRMDIDVARPFLGAGPILEEGRSEEPYRKPAGRSGSARSTGGPAVESRHRDSTCSVSRAMCPGRLRSGPKFARFVQARERWSRAAACASRRLPYRCYGSSDRPSSFFVSWVRGRRGSGGKAPALRCGQRPATRSGCGPLRIHLAFIRGS